MEPSAVSHQTLPLMAGQDASMSRTWTLALLGTSALLAPFNLCESSWILPKTIPFGSFKHHQEKEDAALYVETEGSKLLQDLDKTLWM